MKLHNLKIKPIYFKDVRKEKKTFEIRKDDRGFAEGDIIHFVNVDGSELVGNVKNLYRIDYILRDCPEYGLAEGYCILAIKKLKGGNS